MIRVALIAHLLKYVGPEPDVLIFCTRTGSLLQNGNFRLTMLRAIDESGLRASRIHELRHSALSLADEAGGINALIVAAEQERPAHRMAHADSEDHS